MEEILDILDEQTGNKTGNTIEKSQAHLKGIWHGSIHLLIVNEDRTCTLLQKRCTEKKLYPNIWDIAVGGHISAGETDLTSAQRELEEELGIDSSDLEIQYIKTVKESLDNNGVISNEFVSIFLIYKNIDINDIKLQAEEVSDAKWVNKDELNDLIKNDMILPHVEEYLMINEILK